MIQDAPRRLIGEGRTAEIYAWDSNRVLRLYRAGASREWIEHEWHAFRTVNEAGIPSPAVYPVDSGDGLIEKEGRLGFIMDRIDGPTMLRALTARPWRCFREARIFAMLHLSMHRHDGGRLPSQRERFLRILSRLESDLPEHMIAGARCLLEALPDGTAVCHGDFHPDNILLSERGPIIIDWGPATAGHPLADVAWTEFLFAHGGAPSGMPFWRRWMLTLFRRLFLSRYRTCYLRGSGWSKADLASWRPINAVMRWADGIEEERGALTRQLERYFPLPENAGAMERGEFR